MVLVLMLVSALAAATGLPLWAAALIVLSVVLVLATVFGWLGYRRVQRARLMPEETIAAAKEDLEWAQHWTKRD
jgi:membrane protein DedA with SNARE-associated domain